MADARLDMRVLAFGFLSSLVLGAVCGLAPALDAPRPEVLTGARATARTSLLGRRLLVGGQMAVTLVLLACAGILLQSLWNQERVALGIRMEGVATAEFVFGPRYGKTSRRAAFYEQLETRLKQRSGVESVALSDSLPPAGVPRSQPIFVLRGEGKAPIPDGTPGIAVWRAVTPDYFRALGIPILCGRSFTEEDRSPAGHSLVISAALERRLFGAESAVGRRMARFPGSARNPTVWYTIVGVAADVRNAGLKDRTDPEYYMVRRRGAPAFDDAPMRSCVILRGPATSEAMESWLHSEIAALDPGLPAVVQRLDQHVGQLAVRQRFQAWLLTLFAALALMLATFGLYGLVSFIEAQRRREMGVRIALGATPRQVAALVVADGLRWTTVGLVFGLAGAAAAARALRSLLCHVSPADPKAHLAAAASLAATALIAAYLPSRRAAAVDPSVTLKMD